jgi:hypothetical protein
MTIHKKDQFVQRQLTGNTNLCVCIYVCVLIAIRQLGREMGQLPSRWEGGKIRITIMRLN